MQTQPPSGCRHPGHPKGSTALRQALVPPGSFRGRVLPYEVTSKAPRPWRVPQAALWPGRVPPPISSPARWTRCWGRHAAGGLIGGRAGTHLHAPLQRIACGPGPPRRSLGVPVWGWIWGFCRPFKGNSMKHFKYFILKFKLFTLKPSPWTPSVRSHLPTSVSTEPERRIGNIDRKCKPCLLLKACYQASAQKSAITFSCHGSAHLIDKLQILLEVEASEICSVLCRESEINLS